jgi:hypothetical protein
MYNGYLGVSGMGAGFSFLLVLLVWTLFWKGLALWHASRRGEYWWFVALLIVNTVGILEIVYLFVFAKIGFDTLFSMGGTAEKPGEIQA